MKTPQSLVRADTEEGRRAGEAIVETVENQIREGRPAAVRATLERLMQAGETRENALRYIACALSLEIFEVLEKQNPYDEARYVRHLEALPELPYDEDEI